MSQIWSDLKEDEIISLMDQLAKVESTMMSISFPAGGSIYYARDLKELSGNEGIPFDVQVESITLEKERFCIGPDVSVPLWYGRREQLNVFRGPYEDAKSVLVAGAKKELTYVDHFGAPRVPYQRFRREYYKYEKQTASDHVKNLGHYLRLAPSLVPDDDSLSPFCIRHPDLTDSNLRVSTDSGGLQILSMLDWQHAAVLPLFLHAGMPSFIRTRSLKRWSSLNYRMTSTSYRKKTKIRRGSSSVYPLNPFRRRIFIHATAMWEGETIKLLYALIDFVLGWEQFATDGTPCPVVFTEKEIVAAEKLYQDLANAERGERWLRENVGYGEETWVLAAHYEAAKAFCQEVKRRTLKACAEDEETTKEAYAVIEANWSLDDMDEEEIEDHK